MAMLTKEDAHKATGMKVSEITEIEEFPGGYRVHTHDGQYVDLEAAPAEVEAPAEESKDADAEAKKTPARGRKA